MAAISALLMRLIRVVLPFLTQDLSSSSSNSNGSIRHQRDDFAVMKECALPAQGTSSNSRRGRMERKFLLRPGQALSLPTAPYPFQQVGCTSKNLGNSDITHTHTHTHTRTHTHTHTHTPSRTDITQSSDRGFSVWCIYMFGCMRNGWANS